MLQHPPVAPPAGPKIPRSGRQPNRGGIQKRKGAVRTDRDGDLDMEETGGVKKARGRGRVVPPLRGSFGAVSTRNPKASRPARASLNTSAMQKAILRGMGADETIARGPRHTPRITRQPGRSLGREQDLSQGNGLEQVIVRGLKQSKAASNPDGGISDLLGFLERKATVPDAAARDVVRIKKSRLDGDALIVFVRKEDVMKILRLDKFLFAGATLHIEFHQGKDIDPQGEGGGATNDISMMLKAVLSRRYDPVTKLLDLSNLGSDPELVNMGMFSTTARESKFFPALMKVCDSNFTTAHEKAEAIISVSLASNALTSIASVTSLAQTLPAIKNLDLSNNQFRNLSALEGWRWKFRHLDHLILSGNPLETEEPSYENDIIKWYPILRTLNTIQVRTLDEIKAATSTQMSIPVRGPSFRDEANIGETFVKQFFPAYDSDRVGLVNGYYDAESMFSLSINVSAPRGAEAVDQKAPCWDGYIKRSRNLVKVTQTPARMSRLHTGPESIQQCWLTLPSTHHVDLLREPQKWCIECNSIPGLPDPTGQSLGGVGGLIVTVHGEFSEVDVSTGQMRNKRSFDRTFVLGPGAGVGGVRVLCDTLVLRAWGGSDAWKPDLPIDNGILSLTAPPQQPYSVQVPLGFGAPVPGKTEEDVRKEILAIELSRRTGMTLEYSGMCLQQSGWNLDGAVVAFEQVRGVLPADAFFVAT